MPDETKDKLDKLLKDGQEAEVIKPKMLMPKHVSLSLVLSIVVALSSGLGYAGRVAVANGEHQATQDTRLDNLEKRVATLEELEKNNNDRGIRVETKLEAIQAQHERMIEQLDSIQSAIRRHATATEPRQ